jgi:ACT domain-containing protein
MIVVEKLQIGQMVEILSPLRQFAGAIIAVLRHESRSRAEASS